MTVVIADSSPLNYLTLEIARSSPRGAGDAAVTLAGYYVDMP